MDFETTRCLAITKLHCKEYIDFSNVNDIREIKLLSSRRKYNEKKSINEMTSNE